LSVTQDVEVVRRRAARARIAVAYSTKDRPALTRQTVAPLLDDPDIDLYWFDGSSTAEAQALARELAHAGSAVCALHLGVVGGPDCAILHALGTLQPLGYDLVILIENDVQVGEGWLGAMLAAMRRATEAGFRVGGASARIINRRVLSCNDGYCLLLGTGAGLFAFTPEAVALVLENYRTTDGGELIRHFNALTGIDVAGTVQFGPDQMCSADCLFDLLLYLHGMVVAGPVLSSARNIAPEDGPLQREAVVVTEAAQHLPELVGVLTRPDRIRVPPFVLARFQPSRFSPRLLIGCHALTVCVGGGPPSAPVRLDGAWRRSWVQMLGPFALAGSGRIRLAVHGASVGVLLYAGEGPVELMVSGPGGYRATSVLLAKTAVEFALQAEQFGMRDAVISVLAGEVRLVGVTAEAGMVGYYARAVSGIGHLCA
jgi:hypothetical protein